MPAHLLPPFLRECDPQRTVASSSSPHARSQPAKSSRGPDSSHGSEAPLRTLFSTSTKGSQLTSSLLGGSGGSRPPLLLPGNSILPRALALAAASSATGSSAPGTPSAATDVLSSRDVRLVLEGPEAASPFVGGAPARGGAAGAPEASGVAEDAQTPRGQMMLGPGLPSVLLDQPNVR